MTKIAGTVILYHPDDSVISNIASFSGFVEKLYVVDNSEQNNRQLIEKITAPNLFYIHDGENMGISIRLNQVARLAIAAGFDHLLTMDQDSFFEEEAIRNYWQCISTYLEKEQTSMYGIEFMHQSPQKDACSPREVEHLITSGSVINLGLFETIGGFDENLFIDEVDLEYCYRSIIKGYKVIQFPNIFLQHTLGETSYYRAFGIFKPTPRILHSPVRLYYRVRNYLYVTGKYRSRFPQDCNRRKQVLVNSIKNNLIYGKQKWRLIRYMLKAIADFKKGKLGKLDA
jgi:rhamnosyltransferase